MVTIVYPASAVIKISYVIVDATTPTPQTVTQEYTILSYTLTAETAKKIFDAVNQTVCDRTDALKSISSLKFLLTLL